VKDDGRRGANGAGDRKRGLLYGVWNLHDAIIAGIAILSPC
jgi:hypothetical protein